MRVFDATLPLTVDLKRLIAFNVFSLRELILINYFTVPNGIRSSYFVINCLSKERLEKFLSSWLKDSSGFFLC